MAAWFFGAKDKEQDKKEKIASEEMCDKHSNKTEISDEEDLKPGTSNLDTLISATEKWVPENQKSNFAQNKNPVSAPLKLAPQKEKSENQNSEISREQIQNQIPPKTENGSANNLVMEFGILTIEEQKRLDEEKAAPIIEKKTRKKRKTLGRTNEVKVRLTDEEKLLLESRARAAGLKQGEFIRQAILHEKIETKSIMAVDVQTMTEMMKMGSELGKIGGLIKKTVATNKEFLIFTPEEKSQYEKQMRDLETLRREIQKVVQDIYGNC